MKHSIYERPVWGKNEELKEEGKKLSTWVEKRKMNRCGKYEASYLQKVRTSKKVRWRNKNLKERTI